MGIVDKKVLAGEGIAQKHFAKGYNPAINLTDELALIAQMKTGISFEQITAYARLVTDTVTINPGLVGVPGLARAATFVIATTKPRFKLSVPLIGVSPVLDANTGLPTIVNKAITDNILWSAANTINAAAVAGQFWGAWRIDMDEAGVITTRSIAADQNFTTEPLALLSCPAASTTKINLGTITIRSAAGAAFTLNTTNLDAAGTTVNYNGSTSDFVAALTAPLQFVATKLVGGALASQTARLTRAVGCLLVVRGTTDGAGALTDGHFDVRVRPYPMDNEQ